MTSNYRRVETNIPVYNPEGLAEDGECRSKSGDSIVKERTVHAELLREVEMH